jgi:hypothetical protein
MHSLIVWYTKKLTFLDLVAGKSFYGKRGSTACTVVNPLNNWLLVGWCKVKYFDLFQKQPSPQLVDKSKCSTTPFPLYRKFPVKPGLNRLLDRR